MLEPISERKKVGKVCWQRKLNSNSIIWTTVVNIDIISRKEKTNMDLPTKGGGGEEIESGFAVLPFHAYSERDGEGCKVWTEYFEEKR